MRRELTTRFSSTSVKQTKFASLVGTARKGIIAVTLILLNVAILDLAHSRGLPAQEGIRNFGQISDGLYRGAQPDESGILSLKRLGVKTIIDLRKTNDTWKQEASLALAHGILYTNIPFKGTGRPKEDQIAIALAVVQNSPGPVFVHCRYGCDRTGTIIACYRIRHDGWSNTAALAEARRYGFSWFERGMRSYILDFGKKAKPANSNSKLAAAAVGN
jgi:protein tyrosine/serine phosphatase